MVPTVFDLCEPRHDVLTGAQTDSDYAADLAHVLAAGPTDSYRDPAQFFANTFPTQGMRDLLRNVCGRLSGAGDSVAAIFRLDTTFGGGKTHALIALVHAAQGMRGVAEVGEFVDPALVPKGPVRIAAFDGENADPANGRRMGDGIFARTPWGEIAYGLAGKAAYERVRQSDEEGIAPGAGTLVELFGDEPALILLDELAIYLRKVKRRSDAHKQLVGFLTTLFKAVESSPNVALVFTLAIGKGVKSGDAYADENEAVAKAMKDFMQEAESVSARKATILNPTTEDETAQVLRRRLFGRIDEAQAAEVVAEYARLWKQNHSLLSENATDHATIDRFKQSYPFHPDVLDTFTTKTATLDNFQRVRGMLRILGRAVGLLWAQRPADAAAIHLHHIDPGFPSINQEITTRLGQKAFSPAIEADVSGTDLKPALAQTLDAENHVGMAPITSYVARTIFLHSLAFNDTLKGLSPAHLRYAVVGPMVDVSFVEEARKAFIVQSAFLDDRPGAPLRFSAEPNLTRIIQHVEREIDLHEVNVALREVITTIYSTPRASDAVFDLIKFPSSPLDVPDEIGSGRPLLAIMSPDAIAISGAVDAIPSLIEDIYVHKGAEGKSIRLLRNMLVFLVADKASTENMQDKLRHRLALLALQGSSRMQSLSPHQQDKVRADAEGFRSKVALAVQQAFRHLFYPDVNSVVETIKLAHTTLEASGVSERPGDGQRHIVRTLHEARKLLLESDPPYAPGYIRSRVNALRKGKISTDDLRAEFRYDPALPMLLGDKVFCATIALGITDGEFVYGHNDLLFGPGDPAVDIRIADDAFVYTRSFAEDNGIWPRRPAVQPQPETSAPRQAVPDAAPASTATEPRPTAAMAKPGSTGRAGADPTRGIQSPSLGAGRSSEPADAKGLPDTIELSLTVPHQQSSADQPPLELSEEGVLREALVHLWDQARRRKMERIGSLTIRVIGDALDGFKLIGIMGVAKGADRKLVSIDGAYETASKSRLIFTYEGSLADVQPFKAFLEPQLRAATEKDAVISFQLGFSQGLALDGNAPETLTEQLTRLSGSASAYVEARAMAVPIQKPDTETEA